MIQQDFKKGQQWRVNRDGCYLVGMRPLAPYAQTGWRQEAPHNTVLTCAGSLMTQGDGVPVIKWLDRDGNWLANDCEFRPSGGGMWANAPLDGTLAPWSDATITVTSYNYGLDQRVFMKELAAEVFEPEVLEKFLARLAETEGRWVLWDPDADEQGFLLTGNDPFALAEEAVEYLELELEQ